MSDPLDEMAKRCGFVDAAEMHRMVASVNLTAPGMLGRFQQWKHDDGSKSGLEALLRG